MRFDLKKIAHKIKVQSVFGRHFFVVFLGKIWAKWRLMCFDMKKMCPK